jgi:hypothetical protein
MPPLVLLTKILHDDTVLVNLEQLERKIDIRLMNA